MKQVFRAIAILLLGGAIGFVLKPDPRSMADHQSTQDTAKEPLYWVAPMDDSYRRDGPGKSPMGMDLVPVYEESTDTLGLGAVTVASNIQQSMGLKTVLVERAKLKSRYRAMATSAYDPAEVISVSLRTNGWLTQLYAKQPGVEVSKGSALFSYYSPDIVRAQEELLVAISRNNAGLLQATKQKLKSYGLLDSQIQEIERAKKVQESVDFLSPIDGTVLSLNKAQGSTIQANEVVMQVYDMQSLWVNMALPQRLVNRSTQMQTASFLPSTTQLRIPITFEFAASQTDKNSSAIIHHYRLDNSEVQLPAGIYGEVQLTFEAQEEALLIPVSALIQKGDEAFVVLKLDENNFKSIAVAIGQQSAEHVEIVSGLNEGDEVVLDGLFLIDSESSKSSDFQRFATVEKPSKIWLHGNIDMLMLEADMLKITHAPAPAWDWPEMTMFFDLDEDVDSSDLAVGQEIHFLVFDDDGAYIIEKIHIMSDTTEMGDEASDDVNDDNEDMHMHHMNH